MFEFFKDENARTLAHYKTVSVLIERTARFFGLSIP
jgi:hypothetical protein